MSYPQEYLKELPFREEYRTDKYIVLQMPILGPSTRLAIIPIVYMDDEEKIGTMFHEMNRIGSNFKPEFVASISHPMVIDKDYKEVERQIVEEKMNSLTLYLDGQ